MIKKKIADNIEIKDYVQTLANIKQQIKQAQIKAIVLVNKELIKLYWSIGKVIAQRQQESSWGSSIIEKLANDLQTSFPGISGFSRTNIFRMRAFYLSYEKVPEPPRQLDDLPLMNITWWHNVTC